MLKLAPKLSPSISLLKNKNKFPFILNKVILGINHFILKAMKIQHIFISLILFGLSLTATAQKQIVYVDDFGSDFNVLKSVVNNIRAAVIDGIAETNRVQLVDALTVDPTREIPPMENALKYRASYLLQGTLLNREATDDGITARKFHSRENSYKEKFTLRLQLIRTSDGTIIFSRNYEENGSSSGRDASQYNALKSALVSMPYEMRSFIEQYFKVHGAIVELVSDNGRKAKSVYINLGYNDPIKEGQRFDVIAETPINGSYIGRKIGEIRITEITGPKFSLCKVMSKGSDEILKAMRKNTKLHIVSRQGLLFDD